MYMHTLVLFLRQNIDKESGNQEPVSDNKDKSTDNQTEAKGAGVAIICESREKSRSSTT